MHMAELVAVGEMRRQRVLYERLQITAGLLTFQRAAA